MANKQEKSVNSVNTVCPRCGLAVTIIFRSDRDPVPKFNPSAYRDTCDYASDETISGEVNAFTCPKLRSLVQNTKID